MKAIPARFLLGLLALALAAPLTAQAAANLSLTATVTANSQYPGYEGPQAADNNLATWWNAFTDKASLPDNLYELRLDFGSDKTYNRIEIDKRGDGTYGYTVDWSQDGTTWHNLITDSTSGNHSGITGTPPILHTFAPQASRYVRFRSDFDNVALNEFRVLEPPGPYEAAVAADAPVVFYRCEEPVGTIAANSGTLGAAASGTYEGGVTLSSPSAVTKLGAAVALSSGSIRVPDLLLGGVAQASLEFWFKRNNSPVDFFAMYADDEWAPGALHLNLNGYAGPDMPMEFALAGNPTPWPALAPGWAEGQWHHVVVVYDSTATPSTVRYYLDGTPHSTSSSVGTTAILFNGGRIGAWNSSRFLDGSIDEVALYTNLLSASRVLAHYNAAQENVGIATQPADATVVEGRRASFTVVATGPNPQYQWFRNGLPIDGANTASYTTPPTTLVEDGDIFFVQVSGANTVTSSDAILNVAARPFEGYQATVLGDGPLVFYRLDETEGATAANLGTLGGTADGTYGGLFTLGAPAPAGELGTALDLTHGYVQVPDLGQGPMTQVSIEMWVNRRSNPPINDLVALFACNGWGGGQLHYNLASGTVPLEFAVPGNEPHPRFTPGWGLGEWHHLVTTFDASGGSAAIVKFYYDGALFGQMTAGAANPIVFSGGLIGAWTWGNPAEAMRYLDGQVDEFAIYGGLLDAKQVLRHFAAAAPPPPPYAAAVLTDNPAVYYRFEETSGTTAENLGTLGEMANGTCAASGVTLGETSAYAGLGKAISLDGSSGTVRMPDLQLGPLAQATIECWLKRVNPPGSMTALLADDGFDTGDLHVNFLGSGPELQFAVAGNSSFPTFAPAWVANEWHHLVLTYSPPGEPGRVRLYLDGTLAATADTDSTPLQFTGGQIGAWLNTFEALPVLQRFLNCAIDEFAIYPVALPPERVLAHYAAIPDTHVSLTRNPADTMVFEGQSATFTVAAQGPGLGYYWFKNGSAIPGAHAASYTTPPTTRDDDGAVYFVQVSNAVNSVTSSDAVLTVVVWPTGGYQATVLEDAPLVFYRFNEAEGPTAVNLGSLGAAADGTYNSSGAVLGVPSAGGGLGTAVELDGANGFIGMPNLGNGPMGQVTIEFWLQRHASAADLQALFADDEYFAPGGLHLNMVSAGTNLQFAVYGGAAPSFTPDWPVGQWRHVALTFDSASGQLTLYLDGSVAGSASGGTQPVNFTGGRIGAWLSDRYLQGRIDEFAIYGSVLSPKQVLRHFAAVAPPTTGYEATVLGDAPLLYYRFNETSGSTAINAGSLGTPANGTYTGGSTLGVPAAQSSLGTAVELDGATGAIRMPDLGNGPMAQATVEFWLQRQANPAGLNAIFADDYWVPGGLHLNMANAGSQLEFAVNPYPSPPRFTPAWSVDTWHHVAVTFDAASGQVTVYLDGGIVGSAQAGTQPVSFAGGQIGAWLNTFLEPPVSQRFLQGTIDEFAIYGSVLSHVQVLQHYGAALAVAPVLTVAHVGDQLRISWEGAGFVLQGNADLTNPAGWGPVEGGSTSPVYVNLDGPQKFFRLIPQ